MNNHPIRDRSKDDGSPNSKPDLEFVDRHLLESRQLIIAGDINQKMAEQKCARLLAMAQISDAPITLFLSSPGGHVESGDMIHDTIRFILPKIQIIGTGWVASAGALIFVSVPLERRFCLPNTRFLLHQPSGGAGGQATDIEIQASEILRMQDRLNRIFAQATGQSLSRIEKDTDRDYWMLPDEAIEYGLVGKIISSVGELPKT